MSFENIKNFVADDLSQVNQIITSCCNGRHPLLVEIAEHIVSSGGKRLRAILTILSARIFDYEGDKHYFLAASVEAIHTATLLHDDVVDDSKMRRGKATANSIWDNKASILVGDFLFSNAFELMVASDSMVVLKSLAKASSIIAEGEVMQLSASFDFNLTYEQYLAIIKAKTAELFAVSAYVGSVIASKNENYQNLLREFGLNLGISFQIIDDILDYNVTNNNLGKNIGDDFREGKITLPLILLRDSVSKEEKEVIKNLLDSDLSQEDGDANLLEIIKMMDKYNIIIQSTNIAKDYLAKCNMILSQLPQNEVNNQLKNIVNFSENRLF
jgi:octaprenyl-diphosphate synthase